MHKISTSWALDNYANTTDLKSFNILVKIKNDDDKEKSFQFRVPEKAFFWDDDQINTIYEISHKFNDLEEFTLLSTAAYVSQVFGITLNQNYDEYILHDIFYVKGAKELLDKIVKLIHKKFEEIADLLFNKPMDKVTLSDMTLFVNTLNHIYTASIEDIS